MPEAANPQGGFRAAEATIFAAQNDNKKIRRPYMTDLAKFGSLRGKRVFITVLFLAADDSRMCAAQEFIVDAGGV
jgi:hypothetical protein